MRRAYLRNKQLRLSAALTQFTKYPRLAMPFSSTKRRRDPCRVYYMQGETEQASGKACRPVTLCSGLSSPDQLNCPTDSAPWLHLTWRTDTASPAVSKSARCGVSTACFAGVPDTASPVRGYFTATDGLDQDQDQQHRKSTNPRNEDGKP